MRTIYHTTMSLPQTSTSYIKRVQELNHMTMVAWRSYHKHLSTEVIGISFLHQRLSDVVPTDTQWILVCQRKDWRQLWLSLYTVNDVLPKFIALEGRHRNRVWPHLAKDRPPNGKLKETRQWTVLPITDRRARQPVHEFFSFLEEGEVP